MTAEDRRTRRLRELAVSFFAGDAWVKRSDMLAVLDTEGDRPTERPFHWPPTKGDAPSKWCSGDDKEFHGWCMNRNASECHCTCNCHKRD
jgi:hypothetical protein